MLNLAYEVNWLGRHDAMQSLSHDGGSVLGRGFDNYCEKEAGGFQNEISPPSKIWSRRTRRCNRCLRIGAGVFCACLPAVEPSVPRSIAKSTATSFKTHRRYTHSLSQPARDHHRELGFSHRGALPAFLQAAIYIPLHPTDLLHHTGKIKACESPCART